MLSSSHEKKSACRKEEVRCGTGCLAHVKTDTREKDKDFWKARV
jgi:hypothetical protein